MTWRVWERRIKWTVDRRKGIQNKKRKARSLKEKSLATERSVRQVNRRRKLLHSTDLRYSTVKEERRFDFFNILLSAPCQLAYCSSKILSAHGKLMLLYLETLQHLTALYYIMRLTTSKTMTTIVDQVSNYSYTQAYSHTINTLSKEKRWGKKRYNSKRQY